MLSTSNATYHILYSVISNIEVFLLYSDCKDYDECIQCKFSLNTNSEHAFYKKRVEINNSLFNADPTVLI